MAAIGGVANAAATAANLGLSQANNLIEGNIFVKEMMQEKRQFSAERAQNSYQNSENMAQAAQHFSQALALELMAYYQAEKMQSQGLRLSMLQDARSYELSWRQELRQMLRDNIFNYRAQYLTLLVINSIALDIVLGVVNPDGALPDDFIENNPVVINFYICLLAILTSTFLWSMWLCIVIVRRLSSNSASSLELQLFATSEEIQQQWQSDIEFGLSSGQRLMGIVIEQQRKWFKRYIASMGWLAFSLMVIGIIGMTLVSAVCVAGVYGGGNLLTFKEDGKILWRYHYIFFIACIFLIIFIVRSWILEESYEKKGVRAYAKSWMDNPDDQGVNVNTKIGMYTQDLLSDQNLRLASDERREKYTNKEMAERGLIAKAEFNHAVSEQLRKQAKLRLEIRRLAQLAITSSTEEIEVLPESLIGKLNQILLDMDEIDEETSRLVSAPMKYLGIKIEQCETDDTDVDTVESDFDSMDDEPFNEETTMHERRAESILKVESGPIDASGKVVIFKAIRIELGNIAVTSTIRIRNVSSSPLRLKDGLALKSGSYVKDLSTSIDQEDNSRSKEVYHLFPVAEIKPRAEIVIAARSQGPNWLPTSGIDGEIEYETKNGSQSFVIKFSNDFFKGAATTCNKRTPENDDACRWNISTETVSHSRNSEVLITIEHQPVDRKSRISFAPNARNRFRSTFSKEPS